MKLEELFLLVSSIGKAERNNAVKEIDTLWSEIKKRIL